MALEAGNDIERAVVNRYSRHSKVRILVHFVWATTQRVPWITMEHEPRLHAYIAGICDKLGCPAVAVGGTSDHLHLLVHFNHGITVANFMNRIKGASSHFAKTTLQISDFEWQRGYAAFGVSARDKALVSNYVRHQRVHHMTDDLWPSAEVTEDAEVPKDTKLP